MGIEFEAVKPLIGSVVHGAREEIFSAEAVRQCRDMLAERTVLVFPRLNLTDAEQLAFTDMLGARVNLTSKAIAPQQVLRELFY